MRQRKVRNLEEKISEHKRWLVEEASAVKGKWKDVFGNENDLILEIGAGKGQFLIKQAGIRPHLNYIGFEGRASVVLRGLQKLEKEPLSNVRFACGFVNGPEELFSECEIAGIYLNFSDPWPKIRHAGRRLTHRGFLSQYYKILKQEGFVEVKTDSRELYEFTEREAMEGAPGLFLITESTRDLHRSDFTARNVTSEYEEKFIAARKSIYYIRLVKDIACKYGRQII